jgi:SAM-dependent methyltransferase
MVDDPVASGYDAVYAAMPHAPTLRRLWREHACGVDFPEDFYHMSFVTLDELRRFRELALEPGEVLVDLGCGMGGPALWLARETGATVTGVDASSVGVATANERARALGIADRARFVAGRFAETGLDDASAQGMSSEDALQYAPDKLAAFREARRVLVSGGRLVFTAFELEPARVAGVPVFGADPVADYRAVLGEAGFDVYAYEDVPGWPEPMSAAYRALLDAKDALIAEMGEPAFAALSGELTLTLALRPYRRRVLACAVAR